MQMEDLAMFESSAHASTVFFRRFFYRRPSDGILEIAERVYVFDSCFSTNVLKWESYREIAIRLRDRFSDSSFLVFNFREDRERQLTDILSQYDITVMDYPTEYMGCPILSLELICHFLHSADRWISLEDRHQNIVLLHCERESWPTLAFMLAALLIYRKLHTGEQKTLDFINRVAPKGLIALLSPLNPIPSQVRYLQYISRRNTSQEWPPLERALVVDCLILRIVPSFDTEGGFRPLIRIYGLNPLDKGVRTTQMLFSMAKNGKTLRHFIQADCDVVKIDIQTVVQGDVVLECIHIDANMEREEIMFRAMFNTAFVRSYSLVFSRDDIDACWDTKESFTKDFRAEVLFTDMDSACVAKVPVNMIAGEEKCGLPVEAFAKGQEVVRNADAIEAKDDATLPVHTQISHLNDLSFNGQSNSSVSSDESHGSDTNQGEVSLHKHECLPQPGGNLDQVSRLTPLLGSKDTSLLESTTECPLAEKQPQQNVDLVSSTSQTYEPGSLSSMSSVLLHTNDTKALSESRTVASCMPSTPVPPGETSVTSSSCETSTLPSQAVTPTSLLGTKALAVPPPPPPPRPGLRGPPPPPPPAKKGPPAPPPPRGALSGTLTPSVKKVPLKPFHWMKVPKAAPGSLWARVEFLDESSQCPAINTSELASLFSTAVPASIINIHRTKSKKMQLIDTRRANNCEIMLTKVKMPLADVLSAILSLDCSVLDIDQVENLLKFCPTKEEMNLLKGYDGDKEMLGKCEQFFLEMMKVPRMELKLQAFSFKLEFLTQINDLQRSLSIVNNASKEILESIKFLKIMKTILSLGNALNEGTPRGAAVGFKLDSLLKLGDTRARDNKMTLMHYLCKLFSDNLPELLDFDKELTHLEDASKVQLKFLAEEMQEVSKSLEKIEKELEDSETDGPVSENFRKSLKVFLDMAMEEHQSLRSLYSEVGRNVDALATYFCEAIAPCPFEQVISIMLNFVRMFKQARDENRKLVENERKKAEEAGQENSKNLPPKKQSVIAKINTQLGGLAELAMTLKHKKLA